MKKTIYICSWNTHHYARTFLAVDYCPSQKSNFHLFYVNLKSNRTPQKAHQFKHGHGPTNMSFSNNDILALANQKSLFLWYLSALMKFDYLMQHCSENVAYLIYVKYMAQSFETSASG